MTNFWCITLSIVWLIASAFIMVFMRGATKKSKEFEEGILVVRAMEKKQ